MLKTVYPAKTTFCGGIMTNSADPDQTAPLENLSVHSRNTEHSCFIVCE